MTVSFNAAPYRENNSNAISRQGKPPDVTGNGTIFAQHILNAYNEARDCPRPLHFKKNIAALR